MAPLLAAFGLPPVTVLAAGLPAGGQVIAGSGTIVQNGAGMVVTQTSGRLALNWTDFSIGSGNSVRFIQPSSTSIALNRVIGANPSVIQGSLSANGQLFLVNPNGILFSPTAQINVGALVASTLDISTSDFMKGYYRFAGTSSNAVINQGQIVSAAGGGVAMIAAKVVNGGSIVAQQGTVAMAAGRDVILDMGGPIKLQVNQGALDALVQNGGAIQADGGTVYLTAKAADTLLSAVINNTGTIRARTLANGTAGHIALIGDMQYGEATVGGTLDASAPDGGNGGYIETSAAVLNTLPGLAVNAGAHYGQAGLWLIDPYNYTIDSTAASNIVGALNTGTSVTVTTQSNNAGYGSTGTGSGDIAVASAITKTAGGNATLTLEADRDININSAITSTAGKLNITLSSANASGAAVGGVAINAGLDSNGGDILIGGGGGAATSNGIGYALNRTSTSNPAVAVGTNVTVQSRGGNIVLNGQSAATSSNYDGTKAGVYVFSGATINSGGGNLFISGISTVSAKEFGFSVEGNSNTLTTFETSGSTGAIFVDARNSLDLNGALGLVNAGNQARIIFDAPSVAQMLFEVNGSPQLTSFTYHPPCGNSSFPNCGTLQVPGNNGSYLYATYQAVDMSTAPIYVIQTGAGSKVYDGTTNATGLSFTSLGAPGGFSVNSLTTYPQYYTPSKNVGTYSSLVPSSSNQADYASGGVSYALGYFNTGSYSITPKTLTPVASSKIYDGTTTAAVTAAGIVSGDNIALSGAGTFASANVGAYNNVSITGITLSGQDAGNYTLSGTSVSNAAASITPRTVTLSAAKTYDRTTGLSGDVSIGNLVSGETLNYTSATANSATVLGASYISGISLLDGSGLASNYQLPSLSTASSANSAAITPKALSVSGITAADKTYDGTTAAAVSTAGAALTGLVSGDTVTVAASGTFANKNAGSGKTVSLVDTFSGADASNYTITGQTTTTASITPKALSVSGITAADKTYDGTTAATVSTAGAALTGLVSGDTVTVAASGTFADKNAGSGKTVTLVDTFGGADASNYAITGQTTTTADISRQSVTVTAANENKPFGQADPSLSWSIAGGNLLGNDTLSGALTRDPGEQPGTYQIRLGTLGNSNYTVSLAGGTTFTIAATPSDSPAPSLVTTAPPTATTTPPTALPGQYIFGAQEVSPPTVGALTYQAVGSDPVRADEASGGAAPVNFASSIGSSSQADDATPNAGQIVVASQAAYAGRNARFMNVFVVSGGINTSGLPDNNNRLNSANFSSR